MLGKELNIFIDTGRIGFLDRGFGGARGLRCNHQILVVVVGPDIEHVESRLTEQQRKRLGAEIGTMLVVDIPEGQITQHAAHVRHLEEDHRVVAITHGAAHCLHEVCGIGYVFQGHFAAHEIALHVSILFPVEVSHEFNFGVSSRRVSFADKGRIETHAAVVAHLA